MNNDIQQRRKGFETLGQNYPVADGIHVEHETIANIDCYWVKQAPVIEDTLLVYVHGGCFSLGSIDSHRPLVSHLVSVTNLPALFIDYSLAPEAPYPSGLNDVINVCNSVSQNNPTLKIVLIGDSAGGGLIVSALAGLNEKAAQSVEACVLISPWVDLTCSLPSYQLNADIDPILSQESMKKFAALYVVDGDLAAADPKQDLGYEFPPTLIIVGSNEVLLDDSKLAYEQIKSQQEITKLSIYDQQSHVWMIDGITSDAARGGFDEVAGFINSIIGQ